MIVKKNSVYDHVPQRLTHSRCNVFSPYFADISLYMEILYYQFRPSSLTNPLCNIFFFYFSSYTTRRRSWRMPTSSMKSRADTNLGNHLKYNIGAKSNIFFNFCWIFEASLPFQRIMETYGLGLLFSGLRIQLFW